MLARQAAEALSNARRAEELERQVEQRAAELALINGIQEGMAAELNFQAIVDLVGEKLVELFATDTLVIGWLDEPAGLLHLPFGVERGQRLRLAPYRIAAVMTGRRWHEIILSRRPVQWNNQDDYRALEILVADGTDMSRSGVAVPIFAGDRLLGFMSVENMDREHAFGEADVRLLSTVAASMGVALENARLFDETQRLLKETEQRAAELAVINRIQEGMAAELDDMTGRAGSASEPVRLVGGSVLRARTDSWRSPHGPRSLRPADRVSRGSRHWRRRGPEGRCL